VGENYSLRLLYSGGEGVHDKTTRSRECGFPDREKLKVAVETPKRPDCTRDLTFCKTSRLGALNGIVTGLIDLETGGKGRTQSNRTARGR